MTAAASVLLECALLAGFWQIARLRARRGELRLRFARPCTGLAFAGALAASAFAGRGEALAWRWEVALAGAAVCAVTDVQTGYIFDWVLFAWIAAIVPSLGGGGVWSAACAALPGSALLLLHAASRGRGIGLGDVKMAVAAGLALGFPASLWALWAACVAGGLFGAALLLLRSARRTQRIAFGPFLAMGTGAAVLWPAP